MSSRSLSVPAWARREGMREERPLRTRGRVIAEEDDVIAQGIDVVVLCGRRTIFLPANPEHS